MIELRNLSAGYGREPVLSGVSMELAPGKVTALLGPNGCGKSTLLKTILGLQPRLAGEILVDGTPTDEITPRQLAQKVTYLAQSRNTPNISARRMVLHGRFPYLSYPRRYGREDYEMVEKALQWADAGGIADRSMGELSGGQRQKVYLAMALAQETEVIFLDEPTTYLDLGRQFEVLDLVRSLNARGKTVVMVLHDLAQALAYSHQVILMERGRLVMCAGPEALFESGKIDQIFGVRTCRAEGTWYFTPRRGGR